jgi:DNA-binding transcriptional regulator YhcF (GntR family)
MTSTTAEPDCFLYRWYDEAGRLLYVGISAAPDAREAEHRRWSWWTRWAVRVEVEPKGAPRLAAEAFERAAIENEAPIFNTVHAPGLRERVHMYLSDRGVDPDAEGITFPATLAPGPAGRLPRPRRPKRQGTERETQWRALADLIRRRIADGDYPVGALIPTVRQLMASTGRSDNTVSRALAELVEEGLIKPAVGVGTRVIAIPGETPKTADERIAELEEQVAEHEERLRRLEQPGP